MKKARGSALIISMLLITAVSGMAFSIARLLFVEAATATLYENGSVAYYSAESGIEEGFLRYRYNQNAEIPFAFTLEDKNVFRTNLKIAKTAKGTPLDGLYVGRNPVVDGLGNDDYINNWINWNGNDQIVDLRMGYIGTFGAPYYGHDSDGNGEFGLTAAGGWIAGSDYGADNFSILKIPEDEALKINLSGYNFSNSLYFGMKIKAPSNFSDTFPSKCQAMAEIKFTVKYAVGGVKEFKSLFVPTGCASNLPSKIKNIGVYEAINSSLDSSDSYALSIRTNRIQDIIDVKSFGVMPSTNDEVVLSVRPINYDAYIGLTTYGCVSIENINNSNCNKKSNVPSGPYTYIQTTGFYAGVSKKLEANIDRQSGTLYDLYDYVIFKP